MAVYMLELYVAVNVLFVRVIFFFFQQPEFTCMPTYT